MQRVLAACAGVVMALAGVVVVTAGARIVKRPPLPAVELLGFAAIMLGGLAVAGAILAAIYRALVRPVGYVLVLAGGLVLLTTAGMFFRGFLRGFARGGPMDPSVLSYGALSGVFALIVGGLAVASARANA